MPSFFSTAGLSRRSGSRPWLVVAAWVLALVLAGALLPRLGDALTTDATFTNEPESLRGFNALEDAGLRDDDALTETIVIRSEEFTVDSPEFQAVVTNATAAARSVTEWVDPDGVFNYYEASGAGAPEAAALVSADRHATIIPVQLLAGAEDEPAPYLDAIHAQSDAAEIAGGFELLTVGTLSINEEFNTIAEEDLARGEGIGGIVALIVLVFVFGALLAPVVPIALAVTAIVVSLGLTAALGYFFNLSFFITNMISMIGLAVGIDYALFIVERYREERRRRLAKLDAIEFAGATASKAVLFSGATVVVALLGMFLVPSTIFRSLAVGAILVVVVAVAATLTLIPAILALLGDKIDWPRRRRYDAATAAKQAQFDHETIHSGFWGRVTKTVMGRPVIAVVATVVLLLAAALPLLNLNTGFAGVETLPAGESRDAFEILNADFSAGRLAPVQIVVEGTEAEAGSQIEALSVALTESGFYSGVAPVEWSAAGDIALVEATLAMGPNDPAAFDEIDRLRDTVVPSVFGAVADDVSVTGETAFNADFFAMTSEWTPIVFAFVLGLSFLLLMVVFRSIVLPLKAIILNLLSVGAAYGLLVLVFQEGVGAGLFGFQESPTIEAWIPIFLFCVLFGLSMDYHVFLLSRIKEHYDATKRNSESVAVGLQSTARIITGAALIMVAVFGGFAAGRLVFLQQVGFGLAVAVLIDATVIRSILVPASMAILGKWNWYLPSWLNWLPNLNVEGPAQQRTAAAPSGIHPGGISPVPTEGMAD